MTEPHLFKRFLHDVHSAIAALGEAGVLPAGLDLSRVSAEPPRDPAHGDLSTNAAMVLAKPVGQPPRQLAQAIADQLMRVARLPIAGCSVDGPGFLNVRLAESVWGDELTAILAQGVAYGDSDMGGGQRVNVEYVSANPTGPLHVGHARGTVVGDVLASLLAKAGHSVTREYYINDAGAQVDQLARSVFLRYREALGEAIGPIPDGYYPGDYLKPVGTHLVELHGAGLRELPEAEWLPVVRQVAIDDMMALIRADLAGVGVHHDCFSSERALVASGAVEQVLADLEQRGLVYVGVLEPPKGKPPEDWEPRPQTLFRATQFGDDVDRPLKKSDGSWTYFATDIAYHAQKARLAPDLINILGADHGGYVKRMQAAVKAVSNGTASLEVRLCQMVNLMENGEPVKMSKRSGSFVTLRDVVDQVGRDVVRFIMLTRKNDAPLDFDLVKVAEQSKDNPVFYVQYAHARTASVLRHAAAEAPQTLVGLSREDLNLLTDEAELALIRRLAGWPRLIEAAAETREPHRIAFYLGEVAADFHALWNKGSQDASLRFIQPAEPALTRARLALVRGLKTVIASGLAVLGVEPAEELR